MSLSPPSRTSVGSPKMEMGSEPVAALAAETSEIPVSSAVPVASGCSLFVGRLAFDCRPRELEELFGKYGRITRCDIKRGYAFVEFEDERDATDAIKYLDGTRFLGFNITVERTKNDRRQSSNADGSKNRDCFKCGKPGHYARECRGGGDRDRDRGGRYDRVDRYERSRSDRYEPRGGDRYSRNRSRSRSVSRSPPRRRDYSRSRSPVRRGGEYSPVRRSYGGSRRSPSRSRSPRRN